MMMCRAPSEQQRVCPLKAKSWHQETMVDQKPSIVPNGCGHRATQTWVLQKMVVVRSQEAAGSLESISILLALNSGSLPQLSLPLYSTCDLKYVVTSCLWHRSSIEPHLGCLCHPRDRSPYLTSNCHSFSIILLQCCISAAIT